MPAPGAQAPCQSKLKQPADAPAVPADESQLQHASHRSESAWKGIPHPQLNCPDDAPKTEQLCPLDLPDTDPEERQMTVVWATKVCRWLFYTTVNNWSVVLQGDGCVPSFFLFRAAKARCNLKAHLSLLAAYKAKSEFIVVRRVGGGGWGVGRFWTLTKGSEVLYLVQDWGRSLIRLTELLMSARPRQSL